MRKWLIFIILSFSASVFAVDHYDIAKDHLISQGFGHNAVTLEQSTSRNLFYIEKFVIDTDESICHVGIILDLVTGEINFGEGDSELILDFPYSDTLLLVKEQLIMTCAD